MTIGPARLGCAVAVTLASFVSTASAQEPPAQDATTKGTVIKGRAPISDQVLKVKAIVPVGRTLPNGLHVMVIEDRRAPQVRFDITIPGAGAYFDPADRPGLAEFAASMLREGAGTRSSAEISEQLERLSASFSVASSAGGEDAVLSATCLSEHIDTVVGLAADVLMRPTFPDRELARAKSRALAQASQQRSQPTFLATERLLAAVNGHHPSGHTGINAATVEGVSREALVAFHAAHYVPDHAVIAFIGDITAADALEKVEAAFGGWKKAGSPVPEVTDPAPPPAPGIFLVDRPKSVQTVLRIAAPAIRRTAPEFPAFTVLNRVVGGGSTGRLFRHLREDKGYTYGAYSFLVLTQRYAGYWNITTDVRTEVTGPALTDALDEVRQVRETRIPDKEFADAKRALIASFALSLEQPQSILLNAMRTWRWKLPADYWEKYPGQINAVTPADAQAIARRFLDPSKLQIIAVGDGAVIGSVLKPFGSVVTYDTEGKRVGSEP